MPPRIPRADETAAVLAVPALLTAVPAAEPRAWPVVAEEVGAAVGAMPDLTRTGVRAAGAVTLGLVRLRLGAPAAAADPVRVAHVLDAVARRRVPLVAELLQLLRGLAVVVYAEDRARRERALPGGSASAP